MRGALYTVAIEISNTLSNDKVQMVIWSFTILSRSSFDFYLPQCTKRPVHSPLVMVSDATVGIRSHAMIAINMQNGIFSQVTD